MKILSLILAAFALWAFSPCFALSAQAAGKPATSAAWSYHEKNYEIDRPRLSPDNTRLVFVRKLHSPDGHEAELYSDKELRRFDMRIQKNPRLADPEVVLMNLADKSMRFIDYGWEPVFSPDGKTLLYTHQTRPISGYRDLAASLAGNEIRIHNLERDQHTTVARPSAGLSLCEPVFTDKGVLFALSDAVNGAWAGAVGVGMADLATGEQKILYQPVKEHDLYHLVRKFTLWDDACLVLRMRPLTGGAYLADAYAYELVDAAGNNVLYSWGEHDLGDDVQADCRICPSGLEVYDKAWKALAPDTTPAGKKPLSPASSASFAGAASPIERASPDCARVARISEGGKLLTILSAQGETTRRWTAPKGESISARALAWSPDASHLALVLSHGDDFEKFDFDKLVVLRVDELPAGK
jgi:hypothetical protein